MLDGQRMHVPVSRTSVQSSPRLKLVLPFEYVDRSFVVRNMLHVGPMRRQQIYSRLWRPCC